MKNQPNRDYISDDNVSTPQWLANAIVKHFNPSGHCLEPCCGWFIDTPFVRSMFKLSTTLIMGDVRQSRAEFCTDFLTAEYPHNFDWIITNPPWSKIRPFMQKAFKVSDNVVFLMTVNHAFTKARMRDTREAGFHIHEILFVPMPTKDEGWPSSGFQLGAVHWKKGPQEPVEFSYLI